MRELVRHRDFRILLIGQVVSMFGDTVLLLGLAMWTKELTGSTSAAGSVILVLVLPGVFAPLLGVAIDRFPRRSVLLVTDTLSVFVVLLLMLVNSQEDLWVIYVVAFFYGTALVVGSSARAALLPSIVDDEQLPTANASLTTAREALRLIGPLTGAVLLASFGGHALALLDSASFVVSVVCLLMIHPTEVRAPQDHEGFREEASAGFRHIVAEPVLRRLLIVAVVFCSAIGISESVIFAVADEGLGRPPTFIGVLASIQGVGAVCGGLISARTIRGLGELKTVAAGALLCSASSLLATSSSLVLVGLAMTAFGASLPLLIVGSITLIQRRTPTAIQGRVLTGFTVSETVPQTLSIAVGAALVAVVDYRLLLVAMALGLAAAGATALLPIKDESLVVEAAE